MVLFKCEYYPNSSRFKNPIECQNCHNTFCKVHLNSQNECPSCHKKSEYSTNKWLLDILKYLEKEEQKKKLLLRCCRLCPYKGEKDSLWIHLIETHKQEIFDSHTVNNKNDNTINDNNDDYNNNMIKSSFVDNNITINYNHDNNIITNFNNDNENNIIQDEFKKISDTSSFDDNNKLNSNFIKDQNNQDSNNKLSDKSLYFNSSIDINSNSESLHHKKRNSKKIAKRDNIIRIKSDKQKNEKTCKQITEGKKITYCNRKNEIIKCDCCPDHICRENNCMCVTCMTYNRKQLNLKDGQLINKSGKIANFIKGNYFCGK